MKHSKFIKGLTLLSFVFFIIVFLLYRIGKFDIYLKNEKSSLPTVPIFLNQNDTSKPKKDSNQKLILSSSKVLILTDSKSSFIDSIGKKLKTDTFKSKDPAMMSSSKSAIIFKPPTSIKFNLDSLKFDTTKN